MKSIRWKLVMMYISIVMIVTISSGSFVIVAIRQSEEKKANAMLKSIADAIESNLSTTEVDMFPALLTNFSLPQEYWATLIDENGTTIASSETEERKDFKNISRSVTISASQGNASFKAGSEFPNDAGKDTIWMEYAKPITIGGENYVIYIKMDAKTIYNDISDTTNKIAISVIIAMVLTAILGSLFSNTLTKPILVITAKAKELAAGNLRQEIKVITDDELGGLTESFNNMAKELSGSMEKMEYEKNKLEIVLYNMTDGVLAYDNTGNLIHANQVSKELLGFRNLEKMSFKDIIKKLNIEAQNADEIDRGNDNRELTIQINGKFISASFNPYRNKKGILEGTIIVIQDITKHKKLDNMRKEFVANVSHEIRTPLTTIKSYTETLLDGALEDKETAIDFLNVINSESDRMTFIVKDLLELSSLDNGQMVFDMQEISLVSLIKQTVKQQILTAEREGKGIVFEQPDEEMLIKADAKRITQVLGNIISNAIKYSPSKTEIKIYTTVFYDEYKVFIKDSGLGIPKEDLKRIFERFYRVDKARSRAMGGTGLGLSIAKEIMQAHGGKITATSEINKGTTMIVTFPKI